MKTLLIFLLLAFGACAWGEYTPEQIAEWKEAAAKGEAEVQLHEGTYHFTE